MEQEGRSLRLFSEARIFFWLAVIFVISPAVVRRLDLHLVFGFVVWYKRA